jgi:antitoxin HicB
LPPLAPAKLALYEAMHAQQITTTELARRLGLLENGVRRLLDLDHRSHIDQIDRALAVLGKRLEVRCVGAGAISALPIPIEPAQQGHEPQTLPR